MTLDIYQIDAFAEETFEGNPAAVIPLKEWLPDHLLQSIAEENNLSETAYIVEEPEGYRIRWFTPAAEVDLCGHATLAGAYTLFQTQESDHDKITFNSRSGPLIVRRHDELIEMDFPVTPLEACPIPKGLEDALGKAPVELLKCDDYFVVFATEQDIQSLKPNMNLLAGIECRGIIATAPGDKVDFVSRFFAPRYGINEDPVTGSAHCALTPYWAEKLGKSKFSARQLSKRGGNLVCELIGDRVRISGSAVKYLEGKVSI